MGGQEAKKEKKHICAGLLAHVDAGKTTLSEGLLYAAGMIRKRGRVDKQDSYLDTDALERERGITIFSKQAVLELPGLTVTLLDTPGHMDLASEMERTLLVLDYAILVISGADGVQGHTKTLWRLLLEYRIPVFLFINKMDQAGTDALALLEELKEQLSDNCISFEDTGAESFFEEAAVCSEDALEAFLETGRVEDGMIRRMIAERKIFPCYFGSALKQIGVEECLQGISEYAIQKEYPEEFGAKVFKIARDEAGQRLTYLKVTGGSLKVRMPLRSEKGGWEEKAGQIRIYSGAKYETANEVPAGSVCAVTGLTRSRPGEGLGAEPEASAPLLEPALTYRIVLPKDCDAMQIMPKLRQLEEEDPRLHLIWNKTHQEILVRVMGEVRTEVFKRQVKDKFGIEIGFGTGQILYKETIADTVEGVGHFEPLRHYAEVHLLLEPNERGGGMTYASSCSEDVLDRNWQRLALTHLMEKEHIGTLTGSAVTDIKITLVSGKAHQKHTEGGDFREAVYRAVRQGLKQARIILLEPYYEYRLELPEDFVGRAMTDLKLHGATVEGPQICGQTAVLTGKAPVAALQEYAGKIAAYTRGTGRLFLSYGGYDVCKNQEEVAESIGYDSESDLDNPTGSVFCSHGAGVFVEWDRVPEYMHLESVLQKKEERQEGERAVFSKSFSEPEEWISTEEVDAILSRAYDANRRKTPVSKKGFKAGRRTRAADVSGSPGGYGESVPPRKSKKEDLREECLLVDGYNIIYAWEELKELSENNMDGARGRLLDILCNYQGVKKCSLIAVFDAYRVSGHKEEIFDYHNIHVVYTKEAETADAYIEKFAHDNAKKYRITVATSDGMEQIIIRGAGCLLLSAQDLHKEIERMNRELMEEQEQAAKGGRRYLLDDVPEEVGEQIQSAIRSGGCRDEK